MNLPSATTLDVGTPGVSVTPLASGRWRVIARTGAMLGYLEALPEQLPERAGGGFRAMRFSVRDRGYRSLGEFRTATDAADALRFG